MTETFDFVEACVRMKAGKIVRMNTVLYRIKRGILEHSSKSIDAGVWRRCDHEGWYLVAQSYIEYIPTVSGKEAICAYIDDPSLKVRCVDWDADWYLCVCRDTGVIGSMHRRKGIFDDGDILGDLRELQWVIEKGDE